MSRSKSRQKSIRRVRSMPFFCHQRSNKPANTLFFFYPKLQDLIFKLGTQKLTLKFNFYHEQPIRISNFYNVKQIRQKICQKNLSKKFVKKIVSTIGTKNNSDTKKLRYGTTTINLGSQKLRSSTSGRQASKVPQKRN